MTDIAFLWRPEQAEALRPLLVKDARTIPLSQKSCAAAMAAQLPNIDVRYFEKLRDIDLRALRAAADEAVRTHEAAGGETLDRPAAWHNAHEAAFVRAAIGAFLSTSTPHDIFCAANPAEPEFEALAQTCATQGLPLKHTAIALTDVTPSSPDIPADLRFSAAEHAAADWSWRFILAVALADLGDQLRKAAAHGAVVLAVESGASGDAGAIHALARAVGDTKILALNPSGAAFRERGDNSDYAAEVERQIAGAFARPPIQVIVSDLRRVETVIATRAARACGLRPLLRAHGGGVMATPYRFDDTNNARSVWTLGAKQLDRADHVDAPRALRPPLPQRLARLALRTRRAFAPERVGVVVTSGELFAAPEAHLAPQIELFARLCAAVGDAQIILRLRRLEDCGEVWRVALPDARFAIETRDDRAFVPFARDCDLIVELGAESSAQMEAAANGVPYVRIGAPPTGITRFLRADNIVPQVTVDEAAALLRAPLKRAALGLRQFLALERETRPI